MTEREKLITKRLEECIFNGEISEEGLLKIFNMSCDYLNMKSIKEYSKEKGIKPQSVYKSKRKIINKFGIKIIYGDN
jgi:hypothetical protein